ncbi:MAG: hypothetical protein J1F17_01670 [Oscillospiraceae bacterium]|nr:hypothetical protein [Oscillospiraceae bacterium]
MEKIIKKDYPFTIIVEDKIGKNSGKLYQAISVLHTSVKNKDATDPKEKYETTYFNFFDERDLLKLSSLSESVYMALKTARAADKQADRQTEQYQNQNFDANAPIADDDVPF